MEKPNLKVIVVTPTVPPNLEDFLKRLGTSGQQFHMLALASHPKTWKGCCANRQALFCLFRRLNFNMMQREDGKKALSGQAPAFLISSP
jgi:hypothetical protein